MVFAIGDNAQLRDEVKAQTPSAYLSHSKVRTFFSALLRSSQELLHQELLLLKGQAAFSACQGQRYPPAEQEKRGEGFFFYKNLYSDGLFVLVCV